MRFHPSLLSLAGLSLLLASCSETEPTTSDSHAANGTQVAHKSENQDGATGTSHAEGHENPRSHQSHQKPDSQTGHPSHSDHGSRAKHGGQHEKTTQKHHSHASSTGGQAKHGTAQEQPGHDGHGTAASFEDIVSATALSIFSRRILPILKSDTASSCTDCHFAGVELRDFILEDQAKTFASLKAAGMINVDQPDKSKILRFIGRKPEKSNALMDKVREQELIAFRSWIRAAVKEPELLAATGDVEIGTTLPPEVIRHARSDRVLASFIDNIWSEMGRCINCHSPERNRRQIGRNGRTKADIDAISWIIPRDPRATLQELVDSGNIEIETPEDSQLLTKPAGIIEHGGGPKFFPGSPTYRNFLAFLEDFAAIRKENYKAAKDLPPKPQEIILLSEQQLRITEIPAAFAGMALQVNIHRLDPQTRQPSKERWATGFSQVNKQQRIWQNPIQVTASAGSPREKEIRQRGQLPPGSYMIRILVDRSGKTAKDFTYELTEKEFVAAVDIQGEWKPGYQPPKVVQFPKARD